MLADVYTGETSKLAHISRLMSVRTHWCDVCRGDAEKCDDLIKCTACPRKFHLECAGLSTKPGKAWKCGSCADGGGDAPAASKLKKQVTAVKAAHKAIRARQVTFVRAQDSHPCLMPCRTPTPAAN